MLQSLNKLNHKKIQTMKTIHLLPVLFFVFSSCGAKKESYYDAAVNYSMPTPMDEKEPAEGASVNFSYSKKKEPEGQSKTDFKKGEKLRKTAILNFTVEDYNKSRTEIEKIIQSSNAYLANENEQKNTYNISNDLIIRVANKDFESLINKLTPIAKDVNTKNIFIEDATAEFIDIQSRLKSKKEIEARYIAILSKAQKVSDILEIEEKLGEIREEIEAKEGQLKFLSDQVDYSTIKLYVHQDFEYTPSERPGFWGRVSNAFGSGWNGFLSLIIGIVYAWPVWLILTVVGVILVRFIKRKLKKQTGK